MQMGKESELVGVSEQRVSVSATSPGQVLRNEAFPLPS